MSIPQKILLAVGILLFGHWLLQMLPEPRKDLTVSSIETLIGGLGITLLGLSAFYDDDYILPGLAMLAIGIPMLLAYTVEKYKKRSP